MHTNNVFVINFIFYISALLLLVKGPAFQAIHIKVLNLEHQGAIGFNQFAQYSAKSTRSPMINEFLQPMLQNSN